MKITNIYHNKKVIGKIHIAEGKGKTKKEFLDSLVRGVPKDKYTGYAGMPQKTYLRRSLPWSVFAEYKGWKIPKSKLPNKELNSLITKALVKSHKVLPNKHTNVYVFPTFSHFIKHQMKGSTGYTPHKNSIQLYVYPEKVSGWQKEITNTIAHEYTHSVIMNHHKWGTLLDSLVYEGLAEHFREHVVGGKKAAWSKAISKKQVKKYWQKLKSQVSSKDYKLYHKVFFEGKEYPKWTGYTLGYEIFQSFLLDNTKETNWNKIIKLGSKQILEKSSF